MSKPTCLAAKAMILTIHTTNQSMHTFSLISRLRRAVRSVSARVPLAGDRWLGGEVAPDRGDGFGVQGQRSKDGLVQHSAGGTFVHLW